MDIPDVQQAFASTAVPMACTDARGRLQWCNDAFAALLVPPAAAGDDLHARLGPHWPALWGPGWTPDSPDTAVRWCIRASHATPGIVLLGHPLPDAHALAAQLNDLRERMDLVQHFTRTGVFERHPSTMQGTWDARMFDIWGLPAPPNRDLAAAPGRDVTEPMIIEADRRQDRFADTHRIAGDHSARMRIRRPDGAVRYIHTQWRVEHDALGEPARILGVNTDDTLVYELATRAETLRGELDAALALARIGVWHHTIDTDRVYLDERCSELMGIALRPEGLTLLEARARIHPDDRELVIAATERTLRTGEPTDVELRYPQRDGSTRFVISRRVLQHDADGRPLRFFGVMLDITDTLEQRRIALESARLLESAATAANLGVWWVNSLHERPHWNAQMFELLGLPRQAHGLRAHEWLPRCVHPDDQADLLAQVRRWWTTLDGHELRFRIVRPRDGAQRWLVMRGRVYRPGDQLPRRAEGVLLDVTEHEVAAQRLRDTVERMALTARAIGIGAWETDEHVNEVLWDAQMFRLRGVDSAARAVSLEEIAQHMHPDDRAAVMAEQAHRIQAGATWQQDFRVQWPDGTVRWITSHSAPVIDAQGRFVRRIGLNWDSTESHRAAQALREREAALAQSQAKSRWLTRISHELRTPLNAILGFTQLARRQTATAGPARMDDWLALAEDAGQHLRSLIDDILELSGAAAGEMRLKLQPVVLADAVAEAARLMQADARAQEVTIDCGTGPGTVWADPLRLRQVLLNLLSNAIKYNRRGGSVRLRAQLRDDRIELQVADTGLGIPPERLGEAFEAFNRLGAEAGAIPGTGIGLALVKTLVEHMGGSVAVSSEPDRGSVFTVALRRPAANPAPAPGSELQPESAPPDALDAAWPDTPPAAVLYIEDNPVNALLVRELLVDRPAVQLTLAETGAAGLAAAQALPPALILVDLLLPDMHGLEVLRTLRADPRTATVPCVALSANATPSDISEALGAGFQAYWTKPIDLARFLEQLSGMLRRRV